MAAAAAAAVAAQTVAAPAVAVPEALLAALSAPPSALLPAALLVAAAEAVQEHRRFRNAASRTPFLRPCLLRAGIRLVAGLTLGGAD